MWFIWLYAELSLGSSMQRPVSLLLSPLHKHNATFSRWAHCVFSFTIDSHTLWAVGTHPHMYVSQPLMHLQIYTLMQRHAFAHVFKTDASSSLSSIHVQMCFHGSILNSYFYFILTNVMVNIQNRVFWFDKMTQEVIKSFIWIR